MRCADRSHLAFRLPPLCENPPFVVEPVAGTAASVQTMANHPSSRAAGSSANTGVLPAQDRLDGCPQCLTELDRPEPGAQPVQTNLAYGIFLWAMTQYTPEELATMTVRRPGHAVGYDKTFELRGS